MANLTRYKQKIFADNSTKVGVFGTGVNKETSKNVETLQSSDYSDGWSAAIVTNKNYPIWQERDGVDYGFSYQLAYLLQKGIPDWLATETYYTNDFCKYGNQIYYSLVDSNIGQNPTSTPDKWKLLNDSRILHALKSYLDEGELLTDSEGLADVTSYADSTVTGVDTIKPDDYTVVGSLTITTDGIASGFSIGNYIKTIQLSNLVNKSWTIRGSFEYASTNGGCILGLTQTWAVWGSLFIGNGAVTFAALIGTSGDLTTEGAKITLSSVLTTVGTIYNYELSFNYSTGKYTLSVYDSAGTLKGTGNYTPPTTNKQMYDINTNPTTYITVGNPLQGTGATAGSINLNKFKIDVDNGLFYQAT